MLNILIPMAGEGSRFKEAQFLEPKPLIDINGTRMIEMVVKNIQPNQEHQVIFICRKDHYHDYNLKEYLKSIAKNVKIVICDELTEGAACTALLAKEFINNDNRLLIANSDQWIKSDIDHFLNYSQTKDACIMTMHASGNKWSYIRYKEDIVETVVEKKQISDKATVGLYYFKFGKDFVESAQEMIQENDRTNNEFYIAPSINYLIKKDKIVGFYNIGDVNKDMFGLGTPEDLDFYLRANS